jgi:hypothetical protein
MTATLPTPYPFPVAPGGLAQTQAFRPLRGTPQAFVRQPELGQAPKIFGLNGFGAGGGAFIRNHGSEADQSQGLVVVRCGLNPAGTGVLQLSFPAGVVTGQYWCAADWASLSTVAATPVLQINWTATRPLLSNEVLLLAYQWTVSQ